MIENVVQHTAPINPGNSGGPLIDSRGNVAGVNTAIIALAQGLGFAVSSGTAQWVASEILAHGGVQRRQLGVAAGSARISRTLVRKLDLLTDQGVGVMDVDRNGAAGRCGVQQGDIIVAINDRITSSVDDIHRLLSAAPSDASIELLILRNGRKIEIPIDWRQSKS